jgi:hypothetical protein
MRILGRSGIEVSAIGFGCWAIGGPFLMDGREDGWDGSTTPSRPRRSRSLLLIEPDARVQEQIARLQARREHLRDKIDWYRGQLNPQ